MNMQKNNIAASRDYLHQTAEETQRIQRAFLEECGDRLVEGAALLGKAIAEGGKVLIMGNGGSAADAQHMAAEMVGKLMIDRPPLAAIALTTDSSNLTAIGNDFSYDAVFVKQIQALGRRGDVVIAISTSGNSKNVVLAVEEARKIGCKVIALTGGNGG